MAHGRGHNDIEAWLRVVVTRLVFDWWRRLRVHRTRMEQPQMVPAPSEETVLLSAALKRLPRAQAQALALHYLLDLTSSRDGSRYRGLPLDTLTTI